MNGKLKKKDKKEHGVQGLSGAVLEVFTLSVCLAPGTQNILCEYSFGMGANMASRLATGSEDDIFATNS